MTIQEAMHKAVEGGYHIHDVDEMDIDHERANKDFSAWTSKETDSTCVVGVNVPWLDPHFWRALGLALGWYKGVATKCLVYEQWWRQPWHRFIDHLADGHTPEDFFARVPCPQPAASRRQHI